MILDRKTHLEILKSVEQYEGMILKEMNLIVRIVNPNGKVYKSALIKWEKDEVFFAAPLERCDWVIFPLPIELEIWFITKQTVLVSHMHVTARQQLGEKLLYKGQLMKPFSKKQQRAHFRLATLFQVKYHLYTEKVQEESKAPIGESREEGVTVNISVGGMCMVSKQQLAAQNQIDMTFKFLDHEFNVLGRVLEAGEKNANGTYNHRIQFLDLDSRKEDLLSKLIFEKQRRLMKPTKQPLYKR